jgi:hypothetical protein
MLPAKDPQLQHGCGCSEGKYQKVPPKIVGTIRIAPVYFLINSHLPIAFRYAFIPLYYCRHKNKEWVARMGKIFPGC